MVDQRAPFQQTRTQKPSRGETRLNAAPDLGVLGVLVCTPLVPVPCPAAHPSHVCHPERVMHRMQLCHSVNLLAVRRR